MNKRQKKKQQQNKHHISYRRMKYLMRYNCEKVVIQRRKNNIPYKNCRQKTWDRVLSEEERIADSDSNGQLKEYYERGKNGI